MNSVRPTELRLAEAGELLIAWSDGMQSAIPPAKLRAACPCATCREKHASEKPAQPRALPVLKPEETRPLRVAAMRPVGNYAYGIQFSDGHSSGLFTLELLRQLGTPATP